MFVRRGSVGDNAQMTTIAVPAGPDDITSGWVSDILGRAVDIGPFARVGEDYGFASELYLVETSSEVAEPLIVKLWDTSTRAGVRELGSTNNLQVNVQLRSLCSVPVVRIWRQIERSSCSTS